MNSTLDVIHRRRSVRVYDQSPLIQEEKDAIIQAAMRSPTAGGMMLYTIIEVEDQALKERLVKTCDNQPFIAAAPFVLLFIADYQRWIDLYMAGGCEARALELGVQPRKPAEGDLFLAFMDTLIAAQTAVLAAESMGIGSCYIGDIIENFEIHQELFNLPQYAFPAALLCFGRSAEKPNQKPRPRYAPEFIVHKNSYKRFDVNQLNEMQLVYGSRSFEARDYSNGAENIIQYNYLRKFTADFSTEMTRSVRAIISNWCRKPDDD